MYKIYEKLIRHPAHHAFDRICWLLYIFCSPQWFFMMVSWILWFMGLGMTAARHSEEDDLRR